jgi:uncharacterized protein YbbK (DUF523 family)
MQNNPGPIRVGVSACLLGWNVRYDGGHKREDSLAALGKDVEWVPVCPEMELGLGAPREPIRLERRAGKVRLMAVDTRRDLSGAMARFASRRAAELLRGGLSGFILKKDSPSCGAGGVKVHSAKGWTRSGRGVFARALMEADPRLPIAEEDELRDARRRKAFLKRVLAYRLKKAAERPRAATRPPRPSV